MAPINGIKAGFSQADDLLEAIYKKVAQSRKSPRIDKGCKGFFQVSTKDGLVQYNKNLSSDVLSLRSGDMLYSRTYANNGNIVDNVHLPDGTSQHYLNQSDWVDPQIKNMLDIIF